MNWTHRFNRLNLNYYLSIYNDVCPEAKLKPYIFEDHGNSSLTHNLASAPLKLVCQCRFVYRLE